MRLHSLVARHVVLKEEAIWRSFREATPHAWSTLSRRMT
jgi:hypothetical protein